jgi:hypothetical protein
VWACGRCVNSANVTLLVENTGRLQTRGASPWRVHHITVASLPTSSRCRLADLRASNTQTGHPLNSNTHVDQHLDTYLIKTKPRTKKVSSTDPTRTVYLSTLEWRATRSASPWRVHDHHGCVAAHQQALQAGGVSSRCHVVRHSSSSILRSSSTPAAAAAA